jgi:FKBP-type peptidyl-prolyl cis-trans isomerase 2
MLSLVFVVSCATVPDVPLCAEVSLSKGICTYTVSGKNIVVDDEHPLEGQTWFDMRSKVLAVPASSWAEIKAWMIKMCKKNKCDADISSWDRAIDKK